MNRSLYLFNPDHDLALANSDENFNSPQSARTFAHDLACLPMWYAEADDTVWGAMPYREWMEEIKCLFPQLEAITVTSKPDLSQIDAVCPWGWNSAIAKSIQLQGVESDMLPSSAQLAELRNLSHRETAIRAMQFLRAEPAVAAHTPIPAQLISAGQVADFIGCYPQVIFKAPWSSSGKGLCWANGSATESILGWCRNIAEKQGAVVAEQAYHKVQDFAMEFLCREGESSFVGYSLFNTERGVYRSNELMSDDAIVEMLTQNWLSKELLAIVQERLRTFISREIAPVYRGYLGVDLFVYEQNDRYLLHPCVEINLRMTMGMVARIFHDRFVSPDRTGKFYIDHFSSVGTLLADHQNKLSAMPLRVSEGRIVQGYLSLSPISKNSHYRARIEIL